MVKGMAPKKLASFLIIGSKFDELLKSIEAVISGQDATALSKLDFVLHLNSRDTTTLLNLSKLPHDKVSIRTLLSEPYQSISFTFNKLAQVSTGLYLVQWSEHIRFENQNWLQEFERQVAEDGSTVYSYWFSGLSRNFLEGDKERLRPWPYFTAHHRLLYDIVGYYCGKGGCHEFFYYLLAPIGLHKKIDSINLKSLVKLNEAPTGVDFKEIKWCQKKILSYVAKKQQATNLKKSYGQQAPQGQLQRAAV